MLPTFDYDMRIISALDDEPNDVGGLTASELKGKFDEGGLAIQAYLNEALLPGVRQEITDTMADAVVGRVPGMTVIVPLGEDLPAARRTAGAVYWNVTAALS